MASATSIFVILFYLLICGYVHAYYGDLYNKTYNLPALDLGVSVAVEDTIYILGGKNAGPSYATNWNITTLKFDSHQNAITGTITNNTTLFDMYFSCAYTLGDNKTIVVANVHYPDVKRTNAKGKVSYLSPSGISFYDIPSATWTHPQLGAASQSLLPLRWCSMSAISPENNAIYLIGGYVPVDGTPIPDIYRYDLKNTSSAVNMTAMHTNLKINTIGASSNMLPNGVVVLAFGKVSFLDKRLLNTSQVTLFDTRTNQIYNQNVSGDAPTPRFSAGSALGPDKSTIYYYGGGDQFSAINSAAASAVPGLVALDTITWTWFQPKIPGLPSAPFIESTLTLFQNTKLVVALGYLDEQVTQDIGVIADVPQSRNELQNSKMHWFTNNESLDQINSGADDDRQRISKGAIAGIVVAILIVIILLLALLSRRFPKMRMIGSYIKDEIIWQPRSGEPLWAEAARFLVRLILLFLFLTFVVYSIYRSIDSPVVVQEVRKSTSIVRVPDIRFCLSGFDSSVPSEPLKVSCILRNGTDCSSQVLQLDMTKHAPNYHDFHGTPTCFMFVSTPAYSLIDDRSKYTKMVFNILGTPNVDENDVGTYSGRIYVNMYAPDYNPNMKAYQLDLPTKVGLDEYREWDLDEQDTNLMDTVIINTGVRSTALYDIVERRVLRPNDGWNFVGFSSNYEETSTVNSFYTDVPQNIILYGALSLLAQLTVQPSSFTINTSNEQKVFTLLNAFAQIGGVLGLFVAVQTILFGFRPQSPWGIVHRWSFGRLRIKLTDKLANYFDRMGTPVPLVNPVSNRLSTVFKNNAYGSDYAVDEAISQDDRVDQLEERLQLMELLLKSYYLNDEVFRSLDQAVKRNNDEEGRSSMGGIKRRSTDSVLADASNKMLELSANIKADEENASTAGINRRSSVTVSPQQRDID